MFIKIIVVVVVCCVMTQGISAGYPGFFSYQQPSQGFFPPAPVFYQPRPALRYDVGLGQPPTPPQHYYSPPQNTYRGFSYETRYQDGASSHVVYVTGPQSQELMQRSFAVFRNVLPVGPPRPVQPTLPTIVAPTTNSSSPPVVGRFAPRVSSQPRQFIPAFNVPQFIPPPFPYRSFASPFFNAIPPQLQGNNLASDPSQSIVEPASEVQESMIREVAVPEIISNRIGDNQDDGTVSVPAVETSSASTASTQESIEATSSLDPIIVTEAQTESSSAASVDTPTTADTPAPVDAPTDAPADSPAPSDTPADAADSPATPDTTTPAEAGQATEVTTSEPSGQEGSAPAGEATAQSETVTEEQASEAQTEATSEETTTAA